jgi:hypothetical protein
MRHSPTGLPTCRDFRQVGFSAALAAWSGGELGESAFKVAATMELHWIPVVIAEDGVHSNFHGRYAGV